MFDLSRGITMNYGIYPFCLVVLLIAVPFLAQAMEDQQASVARVDWERDTQETTLMQQLVDNLQLHLGVGRYDNGNDSAISDSEKVPCDTTLDMRSTGPTQPPDGVTDYQWLDREVALQPVQNIIDALVEDVLQKKYSPP